MEAQVASGSGKSVKETFRRWMQDRRSRTLAILLAAEFLAGMFLFRGILRPAETARLDAAQMRNPNGEQIELDVWADGSIGYAQGQERRFARLKEQAGEENDVPMLYSQPFALKAGQYVCSVEYSVQGGTPGEQAGTLVLDGGSGDLCPKLPLKSGEAGIEQGENRVWLYKNADEASVFVYADTPGLRIQSVEFRELTGWRWLRLLQYTAVCLLLDAALWVLLADHSSKANVKKKTLMVCAFFCVLLVSLPVLSGAIPYGFDLYFHLSRISGIAEGLRGGQFPVRVYPDSLNGFGYASPVFYGELLLYLPALLYFWGMPLFKAYILYVLGLNAATFGIMYHCCRKMFRSSAAALAGAALYTTATYRLFNLYYRPALGEASAQVFLPWIVYGFWSLYSEQAGEDQWKKAWLYLTLGFTGVIQTHVITTEIAAIFAVIAVLVWAGRAFRPKNIAQLAKAACTTVLVNLWFLVPFLSFMAGEYNCTDPSTIFPADGHSIPLPQLLAACSVNMDQVRIGAGLLFAAAACILVLLRWEASCRAENRFSAFCLAVSAFSVYMVIWFPWDRIEKLAGQTVAHYLCAVQFPWRYLVAATLFLCFAAACSVRITRQTWGRRAAILAAGVLAVAGCVSAWSDSTPYIYTQNGKTMVAEGSALPNGSKESGLEYLPRSFDPARIETPEINCPPEIVLQSESRLTLGYTVTAENQMAAESGLEFPLTYYPGYRITDNSGGEIRVSISDHGQVAAVLPANYSGTFTVQYQELFRWRAAELISLVTAAALIVKAWADRTGFLKKRAAKKQNGQNG